MTTSAMFPCVPFIVSRPSSSLPQRLENCPDALGRSTCCIAPRLTNATPRADRLCHRSGGPTPVSRTLPRARVVASAKRSLRASRPHRTPRKG